MSTIPCDFCPHPVDRARWKRSRSPTTFRTRQATISRTRVRISSGIRTACANSIVALVDHKLDLFKHIPTTAGSKARIGTGSGIAAEAGSGPSVLP